MGVVNVTPDSFSDGGRYHDPTAAIAHGRRLVREGADFLDVGGESTRPGAARPSVDEELSRVVPVIQQLAASGAVVSVDTMRAEVAREALGAGAAIVNDVSGGLADAAMAATVAEAEALFIAMHWRGHSDHMQSRCHYEHVTEDVLHELAARRDALVAAGIRRDRLVLDPGLGFAKTSEQSWTLLAALSRLHELGQPILLGASRKSFLAGVRGGEPSPPQERDVETAATSVLAGLARLWCVRVHDVASTRRALAVVETTQRHATSTRESLA